MEGLRADLVNRVRNFFPGLMISYTALLELDISELPTTLDQVAADVMAFATAIPDTISQKYKYADQRYSRLK
jgi:hypothetical protein